MKKLTKTQAKARREQIALAALIAIIRKSPHNVGPVGAQDFIYERRVRGAFVYADKFIEQADNE